jgi:ParB/RepB/Spo0J family partition protein
MLQRISRTYLCKHINSTYVHDILQTNMYKEYEFEPEEQSGEFTEIAVSAISRTKESIEDGRGNPENDRQINNMVRNIQNQGLLQPITVIERQESTRDERLYEVVIGNRRFEAWKRAFPDKKTIKCLVLPKDTSTGRKEMLTVSENILRLNYSAHDRAVVIKKILQFWKDDEGNEDKRGLANALGYKTPKVINDWLLPLNVDEVIMEKLRGPPELKAKRGPLVARLPKPVQEIVVDILNEKAGTSDYEAKRIVNVVKRHPHEDPREAVERFLNEPQTVSVIVYLSEPLNDAVERAMRDLRLIKTRVVEKALEEYVRNHGYIDDGNETK